MVRPSHHPCPPNQNVWLASATQEVFCPVCPQQGRTAELLCPHRALLTLALPQAGPALLLEGHFALALCAQLSWKDGSHWKCQGKLLVNRLKHGALRGNPANIS